MAFIEPVTLEGRHVGIEPLAYEHEAGINAFAAGLTHNDAAIAVTRGSLERLDRAELQGVVAHEFSHILNGDMRLNQRLIGFSFGILVLWLMGRWLLRSMRFAGRSRNKGASAAVLDAREVLVVGRNELGIAVDWDASAARLRSWRDANPHPRVVVTGFVARDAQGVPTTLGRNGSDFSGAIFAALFEAQELHIWTDVDGVLSADPRAVPDAVLLPRMSYDEACELDYFGA